MRPAYIAAALVIVTGAAQAQNLEVMQKAMALGTLIGSEDYCGLVYDQAAIEGWIEGNIPADAMDFPQTLEMGVTSETYTQNDRSPSAKTAHCAAVSRTAKHYGFVAG